MDQQLNSLDPKLREAYERVMGTISHPNAQTPAQTSGQTQAATPVVQPGLHPASEIHTEPPASPQQTPIQSASAPKVMTSTSTATFLAHTPATPPVQNRPQLETPVQPVITKESEGKQSSNSSPSLQQSTPFDPIVANDQMHAYVAQEVAGATQSIKTIQMIYIVGGIVFFAVYLLFWMKFFNVASPF